MSISLEWELASESFDEMQFMFDAHYFEIYGKNIKVESGIFKFLEKQGKLFFLVAREMVLQ